MAIATARQISVKEGFETARESINSGKALKTLEKLQELSK